MNDHDVAENKSEPRKCMVGDLQWRYLKVGMSESEVIDLLGEGGRKVLYSNEDLKLLLGVDDLASVSEETMEKIRLNQPYYTVDVFRLDGNEATRIEDYYDIGNSLADFCTLTVYFDKNGFLIDSKARC